MNAQPVVQTNPESPARRAKIASLLWITVHFAELAITAQTAPIITTQPVGTTRSIGDQVTFTANANGTPPLTYQWTLEGTDLIGATNRTLTLKNLTTAAAGSYRLRASNEAGSSLSNGAILDVDESFRVDDSGPLGLTGNAYGISFNDYDNDGQLDLAVTLLGQGVRLFHNDGQAQFTERTLGRLTDKDPFAFGTGWADFNNDGFADVVILRGFNPAGKAPCVLLENIAGQELRVVTNSPIAQTPGEWGPALWGDYDRDGALDIYLAATAVSSGSIPVQDYFFTGDGLGGFTRRTQGVVTNFYPLPEYSNGFTATDLNNDGYLDVVGLASSRPPRWLRNLGGQDFAVERPFLFTGVPDSGGAPVAGDFNNDGRMDVLFATTARVALFIQQPDGTFVPQETGELKSRREVFAVACADYDNDGWLDIFTAVTVESSTVPAANHDALWHNEGNGTFSKVARGSLGTDGAHTLLAAWGDVNNDGFLDLYATFDNLKSRLYLNQGKTNHWLTLNLVGTRSNRPGIGAKVRLRATINGTEQWQLRENTGVWGYAIQSDPRLHFGLGNAAQADVVRIEWPSGIVQELNGVTANQFLTVTEPSDRLMLRIAPSSEGPRIIIQGLPGTPCELQSTSDPTLPWTLERTITLDAQGRGEFASPNQEPHRFYRASQKATP